MGAGAPRAAVCWVERPKVGAGIGKRSFGLRWACYTWKKREGRGKVLGRLRL